MEDSCAFDNRSRVMSACDDLEPSSIRVPLLGEAAGLGGPLVEIPMGKELFVCFSDNNPSSTAHANISASKNSPGERGSLGSRSLLDRAQFRDRPSEHYQLKGKTISFGTLTRIRYSPQIKSDKSSVREFNVPPRPSKILELEKCHIFGKQNLKEDEKRILMMFDRLEPLVNPVRNELDFQGKLKRFMHVCRKLANSTGTLRNHLQAEADTLLKSIDGAIQETMSLLE